MAIANVNKARKIFEDFVEKSTILSRAWKFKIYYPIYIPVNEIRNYYGEKIALYFRFLSYYMHSLIYLTIVGIGLFILSVYIKNTNIVYTILSIVFSYLIIFWSSLWIKLWVR